MFIYTQAILWNYKIDHGETLESHAQQARTVEEHRNLGDLACGDAPPLDQNGEFTKQNGRSVLNNELVMREWMKKGYFGGPPPNTGQ